MGINCCDICRIIDRCSDDDGNPINLDSPLAACSYDDEHDYEEAIKKIDEAK